MKKLLVLTFAMLLVAASMASASTVKMSGEYYARGQWVDNWDGTNTVATNDSYGIYDHEMNLKVDWVMTPYTKIHARIELRDENWATTGASTEAAYNASPDDNIAVEYLYGQHTFMNKTTVRVGLMGTSAWATDFSDEGTEAYRVMLIQPTKIGQIIAFTEKDASTNGALSPLPTMNYAETGEIDRDKDSYVLALVTKVGGVMLYPLLKYVDAEPLDAQIFVLDFGAKGTFGNIGFEAEALYIDYNFETVNLLGKPDYSVIGLYANVWAQLDALKIGALVAYGSYDDDSNSAFAFGDNFSAGGAMILGDDAFMYNGAAPLGLGTNDLEGVTLLAAYVSFAVNEKATVGAYFGYADSNIEGDPTNANPIKAANTVAFDGASAWEVNVTGSYKITPLLTYSVGAAMAQIEYGSSLLVDPDAAIELSHKLAFTF